MGGPPPKPYLEQGKKTAYRLLEVVSDSDAAAPSWPSVLVDKSQYFVALDFKNSRGKDSNNLFFALLTSLTSMYII